METAAMGKPRYTVVVRKEKVAYVYLLVNIVVKNTLNDRIL